MPDQSHPSLESRARWGRPFRAVASATTGTLVAASVALPILTLAQPATAAVTVGSNITTFPNRDMVGVSGYNLGEQLTIEVLRNGVIVGTTSGPAVDTPDGPGLEVNHGPAGAVQPGDCWTGVTPDIVGGDLIRVTTGRGVDTATVADVDFSGGPALDANNNVVVQGTGTTDAAVEFRRDKPEPRFRRGPLPVVSTGVGTWKATYVVPAGTSAEGLTADEQRDIAVNEAAWRAVVDNITETTIAELGEPGGVGPGCEPVSSAEPNAVVSGYLNPVNVTSGNITLSGTAREGVTGVSVTVGALAAKAATLSTNATGTKTWTLPVTKAELATLPDGTINIDSSFASGAGTVAGTRRTMLKDTVAPAAPTATPAAGVYSTTQFVTLVKPAAETQSRIRYTIGSATVAAPTATSTLATGQIAVSSTQTIKARVIDPAGNLGAVATFNYTIGPVVTATFPLSNATGVSVAANVTGTFSVGVTGVSTNTFRLVDTAAGTRVGGAVSYSSTARQATFNPTANLVANRKYTATLIGGTTAIRDGSNRPLATKTWTFMAGVAPRVTARTPAINATAVSRTTNVSATFSEAVTGVSSSTFTLKNATTGVAVTGVVSYNGTTRVATLNPGVTLAARTKYTATLTGGATKIRDIAGNVLGTNSWSFTTGA
ncbi:MAG TPA: Ig-like domain-containing protein [Propionibacteriaceae bacterium]|nr:Ig-like domain-containing protein [Propionibacteriaceae bacterium]